MLPGTGHTHRMRERLRHALYAGGAKETPLEAAEDQVFLFAPGLSRDRLVRYGVLLVLSAIIATGGVLVDSTATVIGAMIVAPLATPILAVGLGVSIVEPRQVGRSMLVVGVSLLVVVLIGMVMTLTLPVIPNEQWALGNSQITGRVSPGLIELVVAIATGLVGSFAITRSDVAGVLPGVAIAISLVPPLAVVGVVLAGGEWTMAIGALLLFLSNAIAMVLMAALVFWIVGYARAAADRREVRRPVVFILSLGAIVVVLLTFISIQTVAIATQESRAAKAAGVWLDGSSFELLDVQTRNTDLVLEVIGRGELPDSGGFYGAFEAPLWLDPSVTVREYSGRTIALPPRPDPA